MMPDTTWLEMILSRVTAILLSKQLHLAVLMRSAPLLLLLASSVVKQKKSSSTK